MSTFLSTLFYFIHTISIIIGYVVMLTIVLFACVWVAFFIDDYFQKLKRNNERKN